MHSDLLTPWFWLHFGPEKSNQLGLSQCVPTASISHIHSYDHRSWILSLIQISEEGCYSAAAKSLQSCPTLCDPIDDSPPGSPVPGILQARTLEWGAISFSNAWKWSFSVVSDSSQPHGLQPTRLLHPWDFPGKSTGVGCHAFSDIWD